MYDQNSKKVSNFKLYLVIGLLVIGAIALVFVFKDGLITGGVVAGTPISVDATSGGSSTSSFFDSSSGTDTGFAEDANDKPLEKVFKREISQGNRDVPITLTFNKVPTLTKKVDVKHMELVFDDLTTSIQVNNDRLQLQNLKAVTLDIENFNGDFALSSLGLSLTGNARRIGVNGVALESGKDMEISFSNLAFKKLNIDAVQLKDVVVPSGEGELQVGGKLTYKLENERAAVYYFTGSMVVGAGDAAFKLTGTTRGASVDGDVVTISVK